MRFLVDECSGPGLARWLRDEGHDVVSIFDSARGVDDVTILSWAVRDKRILITNDKDFGDRVFREAREHCGVVLLRLDDERTANKIQAVTRTLQSLGDRLPDSFVVVTEQTIRISGKGPPSAS